MATVVDASHRTLTPIGGLIGAQVVGQDNCDVGTIVELMAEAGTGTIVYAAVSVGGVLGVGERLFAIPWDAFAIEPEKATLRLRQTRAEVEQTQGFCKDDWPAQADQALRGKA